MADEQPILASRKTATELSGVLEKYRRDKGRGVPIPTKTPQRANRFPFDAYANIPPRAVIQLTSGSTGDFPKAVVYSPGDPPVALALNSSSSAPTGTVGVATLAMFQPELADAATLSLGFADLGPSGTSGLNWAIRHEEPVFWGTLTGNCTAGGSATADHLDYSTISSTVNDRLLEAGYKLHTGDVVGFALDTKLRKFYILTANACPTTST